MTPSDRYLAIREGHFNAASDEYFNARPHLDNAENRRVFYGGHCKGYDVAMETTSKPIDIKAVQEATPEWRQLLARFERLSARTGALMERCQGKGWPEKESDEFTKLRDVVLPELRANLALATAKPIDMLLYCPNCGVQHIDRPDTPEDGADWNDPEIAWTNPPHRTHLCHSCGCTWRPADVPTNGVDAIKTEGKNDSWPGQHNEEVTAMPAKTTRPGDSPVVAEGLSILDEAASRRESMQAVFDAQKQSDDAMARSILHTQIRNAITDIEDGDDEAAIHTLKLLIGEEV